MGDGDDDGKEGEADRVEPRSGSFASTTCLVDIILQLHKEQLSPKSQVVQREVEA